MTRAHLRAHWIEPPSPTGLWIGALLRMVAMLVSLAANFLRMRPSRLSRECHVDVTPETLPEPESGIFKETEKPAASSHDLPVAVAVAAATAVGGVGGGGVGGVDNDLVFSPPASPMAPHASS